MTEQPSESKPHSGLPSERGRVSGPLKGSWQGSRPKSSGRNSVKPVSQQVSVTLRSTGVINNGIVTAVASCAFGIFIAVITIIQDRHPLNIARAILAGLLIAGVGVWIGALPKLVIAPDYVEIRNPIRSTWLAREAIVDVQERGLVTFIVETANGQTMSYRSWGAPNAPRPGLRRTRQSVRAHRMSSSGRPVPGGPSSGDWLNSVAAPSPVQRALSQVHATGQAVNGELLSSRLNTGVLIAITAIVIANVAVWYR